MLKFEGCTFSATGASKKDKVYGLNISGAENISIKDCIFNGMGYSAILNNGTGTLTIEGTEFHCGNIYNPIEGSQTVDNGNVTIDSCIFTGTPANNFISFYRVAEGSVHAIKNCKFAGTTNNNIVRLSNRNNAAAIFNIDDCSYEYVSGKVDEYSGFILCQDYTNRNGVLQDFSKYTVNINNLTRPEEGSLVYVYEDGVGIIVSNYPAVTVDGSPVLFGGAGDPMVEEEEEN